VYTESPKYISLPGAESKIQEYVDRIKNGESKESIFQGLPESFRTNIDARLAQTEVVSTTQVVHEEKILEKEVVPENVLSTEERKKLHGWTASYELAKIAKQQGVDLSQLSREEYVDFAIKEKLMIDDTQLRIAPWQRMGTSVEEIVLSNRERKAQIEEEKEKAFAKFSFETQQKAEQENRYLSENIRVRQGTKDSNSWLFFGINNGIDTKNPETHKAYASVKDLNTLLQNDLIILWKRSEMLDITAILKSFKIYQSKEFA
jgi:hypothetical protein